MNFKIKNIAFHTIEHLPFGDDLYYFLQKYVTKSTIISVDKDSDDLILDEVYKDRVQQHVNVLKKYNIDSFENSSYFEFGAGWDLFAPIGFSMLGMHDLTVVDINPLMKEEQVEHVIKYFERNEHKYGNIKRSEDTQNRIPTNKSINRVLQERFRINYIAPYDARSIALPSESIDLIVTNSVFEHIPRVDISSICRECFRILRGGAIMLASIDLNDHWSYSDNRITPFNFYRYDEKKWKKYNPNIHFQNRLRHCDYIIFFREAGFEILMDLPRSITEEDKEQLAHVPISHCFCNYSQEDLLIKSVYFALRKP